MKKSSSIYLFFALASLLFFSCNSNKPVKVITLDSLDDGKAIADTTRKIIQQTVDSTIAAEQGNAALKDTIMLVAQNVVASLKSKDYRLFASYFHPREPVLFSPYGFIDQTSSKKLLAKDFLESIAKNWTLTWGSYDGTGEKIQLKVVPYIDKFIYNADFSHAEQISFDNTIGKGNSRNNLKDVFPNEHVVEYHLKTGANELDWQSLRLVFKKYNGQYFVVGIIHDQWTT